MPYITKDDLRAVIPERELRQLADDTPDDDTDSATFDEIIDAALNRASSRVDSYISARYPTPITGTVPDSVKEACEVFAKRWIYFRRNIPDVGLDESYKEKTNWLRDVAEGRANIPELDASDTSDEHDDTASTGLAGGALFGVPVFGR